MSTADEVNLTGTSTVVDPPHPRPATVVGPVPAPEVKTMDDNDHTRSFRRLFIGPMPETVAVDRKHEQHGRRFWARSSETVATAASAAEEEEGLLERLGADHVRAFFLRHGGDPDVWGEDEERSVRKEMLKRWNESGWAAVRRKEQPSRHKWTGKTFEVGEFLGVNLIHEEAAEERSTRSTRTSTSRAHSLRTVTSNGSHASHRSRPLTTQRSDTDASYVTAASSVPLSLADRLGTPSPTSEANETHDGFASTSALPLVRTESPTPGPESTNGAALEASKRDGVLHLRPPPPAPTRSALKRVAAEGTPSTARRTVHFPESPREGDPNVTRPADLPPASPREVLARDPEVLEDTSAGAVAAQEAEAAEEAERYSDIMLRDRMLVRVSYTKVEGLHIFDESVARIQKDMQPEDWAEFMVVWRKNRLELYEEYSTPGKEWLVGHKDLSFVVPLHHSNTHLSLYSPTDMSFAITCTPRPVRMLTRRRALFASRKTGTNVFVFKSKSRSRAVDWIWKLWRELGGEIPDFIDIRAPTLGTRIRMDIPDVDDPDARPSIDDIIELCRSSFRALPEWQFLIDDAVKRGQRLALCWRTDTKLDWVWLPTDVEDKERPWAVWYGVALRQAAASNSLEIRLAQHFPTKLVLRDGKVLVEPPAIEGYLHHVRPNGNRARTYLASHDGNIFSLPFARANPPPPPAPPIIVDGEPRCAVSPASEVRRGAEQMLAAEGFLDVRSIVHVRRAETPLVPTRHEMPISLSARSELNLSGGGADEFPPLPEPERSASDDEDAGGDESLAPGALAKAQVRMKRSFELCLRSGQVMRFQANSRVDALEWIGRLNALVAYWTQRHRIDARNEMDLVQATGGRPRFVLPRDRKHDVPEVTPDPDDASPYLGVFWHWCVLEGCRAIIKAGRLFMKHGLKGQYEYSNIVLVSGHLIQFHIAPRNSEHHPRGDTINLLDAYVCSGLFAMQALPRREFLVPLAPKRYQDGLEADDAEEDVTFMIWYHRYPSNGGDREGLAPNSTAPKLNAKRSILVLKARSKLERDSWCWAINCELERIVRSNQEREKRVREIGGLIS